MWGNKKQGCVHKPCAACNTCMRLRYVDGVPVVDGNGAGTGKAGAGHPYRWGWEERTSEDQCVDSMLPWDGAEGTLFKQC